MTSSEVIFGGTGGRQASLLMWLNPGRTAEAQAVSRFLPGYSVYSLTVSPNGTRLAAGTKGGLIRVLGLTDFKAAVGSPALFELFHQPAVLGLAFCTDDILASGGLDGKIRLWSISGGKQLNEITAHLGGVFALCRIGSLVLASIGADAVLRVWDLDTLKVKFESEPFDLSRTRALITVDYNPATGLLAHPSHTGTLYVYDVKNDFTRRAIDAHQGDFTALSYGTRYAATGGTHDALLKVWSLALDKCLMQASTSAGIMALGWAGPETLLAVYRDGSAQSWQVGDNLSAGFRHEGLDLRFVTGLPVEQVTKFQVKTEQQWRDARIAEATEPLAIPEQRGRLADIVRDLHDRGFSAEAVLILADAARSQQQPLWELESLLALVKGLGDNPALIPCLFALGALLEEMKEHELALRHFEQIRRIDKDYPDVEHHIDRLKASPLLELSPENCVRGDLSNDDLLVQELKKDTILERKFRSRILIKAGNPVQFPAAVSIEEINETALKSLQDIGVNGQLTGVQQVVLLGASEPRQITWVYLPSNIEPCGSAFAIEVRTTASGFEFVPCAVFDATLLGIPPDVPVGEHNDRIRGAWGQSHSSPASRGWLAEANNLAMKSLAQLESRIMAKTDDEY